jgi:hypothetical protein
MTMASALLPEVMSLRSRREWPCSPFGAPRPCLLPPNLLHTTHFTKEVWPCNAEGPSIRAGEQKWQIWHRNHGQWLRIMTLS